MRDYQKLLLERLEDNLKNIKLECYADENFEDLVNTKVLNNNIDIVIDDIRNVLH